MNVFDKRFDLFFGQLILEPNEKCDDVFLVPSDQVCIYVAGPVFLFAGCLCVWNKLHQFLFWEIEKFFMEQNLVLGGSQAKFLSGWDFIVPAHLR